MITDSVDSNFMVNGVLTQSIDLTMIGVESLDNQIYEVIRVIDGIPLFCEDHLRRLEKSIILMYDYSKVRDGKILKGDIMRFIEVVKKKDFNIKLLVCFCAMNQVVELIYSCKSYYPSDKEYSEGIETSLIENIRYNPNMKVIKGEYKDKISQELTKSCVFETLLVNKDKQITEGSRSNVFFIKDNYLYTAPQELVLMGITRQYIIEVSEKLGMIMVEKAIKVDEISQMDAAFLSGTSIKALPISKIDSICLNSEKNNWVKKIQEEYNKWIQLYIKKKINNKLV